MSHAIHLARMAYSKDEVPVGAVVVKDGKIIGSGFNGNDAFQGTLDDIRIYNGALTADQIKVLYDKESIGNDLSSLGKLALL